MIKWMHVVLFLIFLSTVALSGCGPDPYTNPSSATPCTKGELKTDITDLGIEM
jgi:hypothetical protein